LKIILETLIETSVVGKTDSEDIGQKMLNIIGDEELSLVEIMDRLGYSHRPTFRKNYLNPALSQGLIVMTLPERPNSPKQRYKKK